MIIRLIFLPFMMLGQLVAGCARGVREIIRRMDAHNGFMSFGATFAIAVLTYFLVTISNNQLTTMQQQLDMSERPWVAADVDIAKPLFVGEHNMGYVGLWVTMTNEGHSVASHVVEAAAPLVFGLNYYDRALKRQQELCDRLEKSIGPTSSGYFLFPDKGAKKYDFVLINDLTALSKPALGSLPLLNNLSFSIVGCIDYQSTYSKTHHHTRFFYSLTVPEKKLVYPPEELAHAIIGKWGTHPELTLFPDPRVGFEAD